MAFETITVEIDNDISLITLNRPDALNALNQQLLSELAQALEEADASKKVRAIVLTGSDKAFAAGTDIKEMSEKAAADFYLQDFFARWTSEIVKKTRKPWIAAVNGCLSRLLRSLSSRENRFHSRSPRWHRPPD